MSRRHRTGGWFVRERGRPDQPQPGRHTPEYLADPRRRLPEAGNQPAQDGLYPLGTAFRVPHDRAALEALDSLDNDPHTRITIGATS